MFESWIKWGVLVGLFGVNTIVLIYYYLQMLGSIKQNMTKKGLLSPMWWLDTESLTGKGIEYRKKYLIFFAVSFLIGAVFILLLMIDG